MCETISTKRHQEQLTLLTPRWKRPRTVKNIQWMADVDIHQQEDARERFSDYDEGDIWYSVSVATKDRPVLCSII